MSVRDTGDPPLSSEAAVAVFIVDQNDHAPVNVSPRPHNGPGSRSADAGHLVAKITAVDADAGQNSRLSPQLLQAGDPSLVGVALHTGEIRTRRRVADGDERQGPVVMVMDSGQPRLSASVSLLLSLVNGAPQSLPGVGDPALTPRPASRLAPYLMASRAPRRSCSWWPSSYSRW